MKLEYAVERLYDAGWLPEYQMELETLPGGGQFPSVKAVEKEFLKAGLQLTITHTPKFNCYRATWGPVTKSDSFNSYDNHGTVVGACPREAAVYALAQLITSRAVQGQASIV